MPPSYLPVSTRVATEELPSNGKVTCRLRQFYKQVNQMKAEDVGIQRLAPNRRNEDICEAYMIFFWFAAAGSLSAAWTFFLGPTLVELSPQDARIPGVMGALLGAMLVGLTSILGCRSGLRQPVVNRFFFGWHFAKIVNALTLLSVCGYTVVNCIIAGHFLNDLFGALMPIGLGITLVCATAGLVATLGVRIVHLCVKHLCIAVSTCLLMAIIVANHHLESEQISLEAPAASIGKCLSFFTLCFTANAYWACVACDYYVVFPQATHSFKIFAYTTLGVFAPSVLIGSLAIQTGSTGKYSDAYTNAVYGYPSLVMDAVRESEALGSSLANNYFYVVLFFSVFTTNIVNIYSLPFAFQTIHHSFLRVPRWILTIAGAVVCLIVSLSSRKQAAEVLIGILPLVGYWVSTIATVIMEEVTIFRRCDHYLNWKAWNNRDNLTKGYAAFVAFFCGVVGAAVGMSQPYYTSPLAHLIGGDAGLTLGCAITALAYLPARYLEIRHFGH